MDSAIHEIGVAVQSYWLGVGSVVAWVEPGIGAAANHVFIDPTYDRHALLLMRSVVPAPAALAALVGADPDSQVRQVAMIDAPGGVASHTGSRSIPAAGDHVGKT